MSRSPAPAKGAGSPGLRARAIAALVVLAFALLRPPGSSVARAEDIQPDRPEVTESANLVPARSVQLESGLFFSRQRAAGVPAEKTLGVEADLRIGVARHLEVNIEGNPFVRMRGPEDDTGAGDVTLGFRYRLIERVDDNAWPPSFAVKPFVKLPVASEPIGTRRTDFGLLLLASFSLPMDFEIEANAGVAGIGQIGSGGYRAQATASAAVSRDILPRLNGFFEVLFKSREQRDEGEQLALNVGLIYRVTPTFAVDAAVQTSVHGQGPDYVIRSGLSVLFGR